MAHMQTVSARSEGMIGSFTLDWETHTWSSHTSFEEGDFPFVTGIDDKRYEIYSDHTFREVGDDAMVLSRLKPRTAAVLHERLR